MGWNDHVSHQLTHCDDCDETDVWAYWDHIGTDRYSGEIGRKLGVDPSESGKCPHCGSTNGQPVDEDGW